MIHIYFKQPDSQYEECYNIELVTSDDSCDTNIIIESLQLILDILKYETSDVPFFEDMIEYGPKLSFETPWCSNIKDIFKNCGLDFIKRIEKSKRVSKDDPIFKKEFDPMTQMIYDTPLTSFDQSPHTKYNKHEVTLNEEARKKYSIDPFVFDYYQRIFDGKTVNNIELFDLAQSNSEHSRHWFFNSIIKLINTENKEYYQLELSLFETVKDTNNKQTNSLVAFKDNASAIKGFKVTKILTDYKHRCSNYVDTRYMCHLTHNAETHNFPTCISPFPGAATGIGGRIRDTICIGKGGGFISGIAGYSVGDIHNTNFNYPYDHPKKLLIEASNGASDYGNKIGEPITQGFTRSFRMLVNDKHYEYIKPIMYSASNGYIYDHNLKKDIPKYGDLIVRVGGPAYSIGLGGGAASSQDQDENKTDYNAVQRGNPEMENKVYKFLKACFEMSENLIISLHDQGSGGMANVTKEIVAPAGGSVFLNKVNLGQDNITDFEIWNAEYQEQCCFIIENKQYNIDLLKKIAKREGVPLEFVGYIDNSKKINVYSHHEQTIFDDKLPLDIVNDNKKNIDPIVEFQLEPVLESIPKKTLQIQYYNQQFDPKLQNMSYSKKSLDTLDFKDITFIILNDLNVCSKKFLTNKVDRSVTGLIAQQQCVGPFQLALSNYSISKLSFNHLSGMASSIGEQPFKGIVNMKSMISMTVGEMLTNLIFAKITNLNSIKVLTNWMWSTNIKDHDFLLVSAVTYLTSCLDKLNISIDGGKDSLSMNIKVNESIVQSPNTLVLKSIAPMNNTYEKVSPYLKGAGNILVLIEMGKYRMGGSIFNKINNCLGSYNEHPIFEKISFFNKLWNVIQSLVQDNMILSGHDRSDGGLMTTLIEMCISSHYGVDIDITSNIDKESYLFNEELGLVLEISPDKYQSVMEILRTQYYHIYKIGMTTNSTQFNVKYNNDIIFSEHKTKLSEEWELPSFEMELEQSSKECALNEFHSIKDRCQYQYHIPNTIYNQIDEIFIESINPYNVGIVRTNGTNGEYELANAFRSAGFNVFDIHMNDIIESRGKLLNNFNGLAFAGGFSYSDVLSSSVGWALTIVSNDDIMREFNDFYRRENTFSIGICNGCQLLSHLEWIPTCKLKENKSKKFESRYVNLKVVSSNSIFTKDMEGTIFGMWSAHGEGRFDLETNNYNSPIRYVDYHNEITEKYPYNPNGSPHGIAALCSENGRHMGIMPHPERSYISYQVPYITENIKETHYTPWYMLFKNAFDFVKNQFECIDL